MFIIRIYEDLCNCFTTGKNACSELDELQTNTVCDTNNKLTSRLDVADRLCDIRHKNNKLLKDLLDRADANIRFVTCT